MFLNIRSKGARLPALSVLTALVFCFTFSCSLQSSDQKSDGDQPEEEEEVIARTEFTDRIENFFEYSPLRVEKPSQFLIHLTDLTDGTPVENADVTLVIRKANGGLSSELKAKIGRVTGIYVAEVALPEAGTYDIEFVVKNDKLNERMPLTYFTVE